MPLRIAVLGILLITASAQQAVPAFEVASVKPYTGSANSSSIARDGGRISLTHVSLRECVMFAYGIPTGREYALVSPSWMGSERFDIEATFPPEASRDQVREMLRMLLAERFGLETRTENRLLKAYELVVEKDGIKFKATQSAGEGAFIYREGQVTVRAFSMDAFADRLSGSVFELDRPVINRTGVQGAFDFTLEWSTLRQSEPGASLSTALQEQLGLRLEARQAELRVLVVERASKTPTSN